MIRPKVVIPARFSDSASALRFRAEVNAHKLVSSVYRAGAEPLTVHPHAPDGVANDQEIEERFGFADSLLLPGGGDITPALYGSPQREEHYDINQEQDDFDLALARWALRTARPILAICRGLQLVNVALGGTLLSHLDQPHRATSVVAVKAGSLLSGAISTEPLTISCFHHQALDRLGTGLRATAWSDDAVIEAAEMIDSSGPWFLGVQWHPEDTAESDPTQRAIFSEFVQATRTSSVAR